VDKGSYPKAPITPTKAEKAEQIKILGPFGPKFLIGPNRGPFKKEI
jgi:hypothetical protein